MTRVQVRPYLLEEFDQACIIRNLSGEESKERFKKAFEKPDGWNDHYRHFGIVFRDEFVGDLQIRQCLKTMPDGVAGFRFEGIQESLFIEDGIARDYASYALICKRTNE